MCLLLFHLPCGVTCGRRGRIEEVEDDIFYWKCGSYFHLCTALLVDSGPPTELKIMFSVISTSSGPPIQLKDMFSVISISSEPPPQE